MLRDELLRSKNDEIAHCLLSRKRKLSELYFATVGYAGATDIRPPDHLYHQKEQAFLDGNDLSRGRFFNETTLPPLPDYASIFACAQEQWNRSRQPLDRGLNPDVALQETATAAATPLEGDHVETPVAEVIDGKAGDGTQEVIEEQDQAAFDRGIVVVCDADADGDGSVLTTAPDEPVLAAPTPIPPGSPGQDVPPGDEPLPPDVDSSSGQQSPVAGPKTPESSHDHPPSKTVPSPRPPGPEGREPLPALPSEGGSPTRDSSPGQAAADEDAVQRKLDHRPSLVLGARVPSVTEQQPLSPLSSIGPYSSNTPVPPAASPDTSPGEEETMESVLKIPRPRPLPTQVSPFSPQPDESPSTRPPGTSTPDEPSSPEKDQTDRTPRRDPSPPPDVNPLEKRVIRD
jgi:chromatin modification-related protein VID21